MKPRYYFNKALEELVHMAALTGGEQPDLELEVNSVHKLFSTMAQCWHLNPEVLSMVWDTDMDLNIFEHLKLPTPVMALEYDFDHELLGLPAPPGTRTPCPARCTVMVEAKEAIRTIANKRIDFEVPVDLSGLFMEMNKMPNGIIFYQFFKGDDKDIREWMLTPYVVFIAYEKLLEIVKKLETFKSAVTVELALRSAFPSLKLQKLAGHMGYPEGKDMVLEMAKQSPMTDDIRVCLGLLQLLQCRNVPLTTINAPVALNKKRAKKKKAPIPSYRTLNISSAKSHARRIRQLGSGTHASPRAHMRRGHIRRQWYPSTQSHQNRWIEPCFVGVGEPEIRDVEVK